MCSFLSNLSSNTVAIQVAEELHSVTWAFSLFSSFLLRETLHEVELDEFQQLTTPLHSASPLQQLFSWRFQQGRMRTLLVFRSELHCWDNCAV